MRNKDTTPVSLQMENETLLQITTIVKTNWNFWTQNQPTIQVNHHRLLSNYEMFRILVCKDYLKNAFPNTTIITYGGLQSPPS